MPDYLMTTEQILSENLLQTANATLVRKHHDANGSLFADLSFPSMIDAAGYVNVNDMEKFSMIINHAYAFDMRVVVQFAITAYQMHADAFHGYNPHDPMRTTRENHYLASHVARMISK